MVLKKVGMLSCGKIMGVTYGAMGLIAGAIFTVVSLLGAAIDTASGESTQAIVGLLFGVGVIIILPVFYGCGGLFRWHDHRWHLQRRRRTCWRD